jgi:hypothetical protein
MAMNEFSAENRKSDKITRFLLNGQSKRKPGLLKLPPSASKLIRASASVSFKKPEKKNKEH